jgi:two-component system, LytTR family, sensor kinase
MNKVRKTELAVATGIYLLILFMLIASSVTDDVFELQREHGFRFRIYNQVFDYYKHYLLPLLAHVTIVYLAFTFVHAVIVPKFLEVQRYVIGSLLLLVTGLTVFLVLMVSYTWYYGYLFGLYNTVRGVHTHCVKHAFIITMFYGLLYTIYYAARRLYVEYIYKNIVKLPWFRQTKVELTVLIAGTIVMMVIATGNRLSIMLIILFSAIYYGFIYFISQYKVFPRYEQHKNRREMLRELGIVSLTGVILFIAIILLRPHLGPMIIIIYGIEAIIVLPLSWWIYRARHERTVEFQGLQKALNNSEAGLDFLRWQINPHFLFNALNTLYGTALQERATATGEGIQKLGDMMRFMLHDNVLESIPLNKEIEYLRNYIVLQRLRTMGSPDILIEVNINESNCDHEIAPMLLIPFVENAFKHGVSQRNRSRISMSLSCTADKIFFDVYNTIHPNRSNDIEIDGMGIGLNNVRQRLMLLYPEKHELSIRETGTEFFVHLTIQVV